MKVYVSVGCSRCQREVKQAERIYCLKCMDKKLEELHLQDEQIKRLHNEIKDLEKTIEGLLKEKHDAY